MRCELRFAAEFHGLGFRVGAPARCALLDAAALQFRGDAKHGEHQLGEVRRGIDDRLRYRAQARACPLQVAHDHEQIRGVARKAIDGGDNATSPGPTAAMSFLSCGRSAVAPLITGCQWRAIPKDLPPRSTLFDYLDLWSWDGTLNRIHHTLYVACREQGDREASPTAAIIDSQSVKSAEKGGPGSIRMAMMRARRSKERSAISSLTRSACC